MSWGGSGRLSGQASQHASNAGYAGSQLRGHVPGINFEVLGPVFGLLSVLFSWVLFFDVPLPNTLPFAVPHFFYLVIALGYILVLVEYRTSACACLNAGVLAFAVAEPLLWGESSVNAAWLLLTGAASLTYLFPVTVKGFLGAGTCLLGFAIGAAFVLDATHGASVLMLTACGAWLAAITLRFTVRSVGRSELKSLECAVVAEISLIKAQRRRAALTADVRTMHDSVLSTLTLVAHRGAGVDAHRLRALSRDALTVLASDANVYVPTASDQTVSDRAAEAASAHAVRANTKELFRAALRGFESPTFRLELHGNFGDAAIHRFQLDELVAAVRECVTNVVRHAQTDSVELLFSSGPSSLTVVVSDAGIGFQVADVAGDRLGIRQSIIRRVEEAGGSARVFSTPGQGTAVVLEVPR